MDNNKVTLVDGTVVMDITDTTATEANVAAGAVFYKSDGSRSVGTYTGADKMDLVSNPTAGDILTTDANGQAVDSGVQLSAKADKSYVDTADANLQSQIDALGEPFRLQDFNQQINAVIPSITTDVSNTNIPNVDIDLDIIDPTGELNANFAIAALAKYEVYDATSGGNRLNVTPICSFSMNGQRVLRVRMMCAGTTSKTARRIQGAILLKHR